MLPRFTKLFRNFAQLKPEDWQALSKIKGVKNNTQGLYAMFFTCNKCNTRGSKTFSKDSYHSGVVLIRCDGCENLHLVADNLGWFRDSSTTVEDLMQEKGQEIQRIDSHEEVLEFIRNND